MKKSILMLLVLALALSVSFASAEQAAPVLFQDENVTFDIEMVIPDGYIADKAQQDRYLYIHLTPEDAGKPAFMLSVAYSESSEGATLNDMPQEYIDMILAFVEADFAEPEVSETFTKDGTRVLIVDETGSESDYATAFTMYKGYFVNIGYHKADFTTLAEDDHAVAIEVLNHLCLIEK